MYYPGQEIDNQKWMAIVNLVYRRNSCLKQNFDKSH